jgi:hypothetical protein
MRAQLFRNYTKLTQNGVNRLIQHAFEGDERRVNELLSAGGALEDAIFGFAWGQQEDLLKRYFRGDDQCVRASEMGKACREGDVTFTKEPSDEAKKAFVQGLARVGDERQVRAALNARWADYLDEVVTGYASRGHQDLLLNILQGTTKRPFALEIAAKHGHVALVETLLQQQGIDLSSSQEKSTAQTAYLNHALIGYSQGRHFQQALNLVRMGANPMFCLQNLIEQSSLKIAILDAELLLAFTESEEEKDHLLSLIEEQELVGEDVMRQLRTYTRAEFDKIKAAFIESFVKDPLILPEAKDETPGHVRR